MKLKKGNTYSLKIEIKKDGENIDINDVSKIVFKFSDIEKEYPSEDVIYNESESCFIIKLTQKDTLSLKGNVEWEVAVKYNNGDVRRTLIKKLYSLNTIIKEEI